MSTLIVSWQTPTCLAYAEALAKKLDLQLASQSGIDSKVVYSLYVTEKSLALIFNHNSSRTTLCTDFLSGKLDYRRRFGGGKNQSIAKAVGLKTYPKPLKILDVTAGLGRDAFILASLGCEVQLIERSPIIAALLTDGLVRAKQTEDLKLKSILDAMQVIEGDAKLFLKKLSTESLEALPEVVYLDPMFPSQTRNKSALTKIEMRILRDIVGEDSDADELLVLALEKAKKRVVVKRSSQAPFMADLPPTFVVKGKSNRYDIYVTNK
jgi:16S rRNA (guanine1516-N2)-methyltransferase